MGWSVAHQLLRSHLVDGQLTPGAEIGLRVDQTLTQDATGTLVMLELEAMGLDRIKTEVSAQYVDHNLIQEDHRNPDDHLFLQSAAARFGLWFSRPGNGVSHPVHQARLGVPGKFLLGADSHTCAGGALGMLAIGTGGLDVALAMAGEPYYVKMPRISHVTLTGRLPAWVSAKDVILEMLRRHGVKGGVGWIFEYDGDGLDQLDAMDRHVIANMGAELGATASVFPSDEQTRRFLSQNGREQDWIPLVAEPDAAYDREETIDLSRLEPLIALPSSPGNVVPVREAAGPEIYQAYVGSSANPGYRDFAIAARMVEGRRVSDHVSFDINPAAREILENLLQARLLAPLIHAGARLHQAGCNGCIGMGQAPASGRISLRTVPRNFPGRSGSREDSVYLCSPQTATASALTGRITDPRELEELYGMTCPAVTEPAEWIVNTDMMIPPLPPEEARQVELVKGPNIASLPEMDALPDRIEAPILLKLHDDISTDEILPAGARVLPYRSNLPRISEFLFDMLDGTYARRAREAQDAGGHVIVAGMNYGQGSSREHAALAPRYLGLRAVVAKSFARIHWQNLINFGVLPLEFTDPVDYDRLLSGDVVILEEIREQIRRGPEVTATLRGKEAPLRLRHSMSARQVQIMLAGGNINQVRSRHQETSFS